MKNTEKTKAEKRFVRGSFTTLTFLFGILCSWLKINDCITWDWLTIWMPWLIACGITAIALILIAICYTCKKHKIMKLMKKK